MRLRVVYGMTMPEPRVVVSENAITLSNQGVTLFSSRGWEEISAVCPMKLC
jgi:hypothetical protein